jgi:hypothetical protein
MAANGRTNRALSARQELAALALASGDTHEAAAEGSGAGTRTIRTWLREPAFTRRVGELRVELMTTALGRLAGHMTRAADTLAALLDHPSGTVKLGACRAILEISARLKDRLEDAEAIAEIQDQLEELRRGTDAPEGAPFSPTGAAIPRRAAAGAGAARLAPG